MNKSKMLFIAKWLIPWAVVMGGFAFILRAHGYDHLNGIYITIPYFLLASLICLKIFKIKVSYNPIYLLIVAFFLLLGVLVEYLFPLEQTGIEYFAMVKFYYPYLKWQTCLTKSADIIFQQSLIFILVMKLKSVKEFSLAFFLLHIPLFFVFKLFAMVFIIPSLIGGVVFSHLILKYKGGLEYSIALHHLFYLLVAIIARIIV